MDIESELKNMQGEVTSAEAWPSARKRGVVVTLPSGAKARIRRTLDMPALLKSGKIPNPLAQILSEVIAKAALSLGEKPEEGKEQEPPPFKFSDVANVETVAAMLEVVEEVCIRCFVEPRVYAVPEGEDDYWEPPEGGLSIQDLAMDDKMFVWSFAMGGTGDLESFREATRSIIDGAFDGPDLQQQTKLPVGAE